MRFERGADPTAQAAPWRARAPCSRSSAPAAPPAPMVDAHPRRHARACCRSRTAHIEGAARHAGAGRRGGTHSDGTRLRRETRAEAGWRVTVPGWRPDVRPAGTSSRKSAGITASSTCRRPSRRCTRRPAVRPAHRPRRAGRRGDAGRRLLRGDQLRVHRGDRGRAVRRRGAAVGLANPLSETFAVMRPSLLPGLVTAVSHNRRHDQRDVRLFEIATAFSPRGERRARRRLDRRRRPITGAATVATSTSSTSRAGRGGAGALRRRHRLRSAPTRLLVAGRAAPGRRAANRSAGSASSRPRSPTRTRIPAPTPSAWRSST